MTHPVLSRRAVLAALAATAASGALPSGAAAQQAHPARAIRLLVGFAPGGAADTAARIVAAEMSKSLGQQVVVENKTGASGNIAVQAVVAAPADGHTLLLAAINLATNPPLMKVGYDPDKDLAMVSQITTVPVVSLTGSTSQLNGLEDVAAAAKAKPGLLKIGSGGIGTSSHLAAELFARAAGFTFKHVPYRGGAPALQALLAGEIDLMFDLMSASLRSNLEAGTVKGLGVMQAAATPALPNLKPAGAQGVPEAAFIRSWQGIAVRGGTAPAIVDKLHGSITAALNNAEVAAKLTQLGSDVQGSASPADFQAFYKAELARLTSLIQTAEIRTE